MLLEKYTIQVLNPPCNPSAETVTAIVEIENDLTELLPYVNAKMGPGIYNPKVPFLRIVHKGIPITIHPKRIAIGKLRDEEEAKEILIWLIEQINSINEKRGEIEPSYRTLGEVKALDVFRLLPKTNCGQCGQPTCLAFATALATGEANLEECLALSSPGFDQQRSALFRLFGMKQEEG